jgi:hypothetical protein
VAAQAPTEVDGADESLVLVESPDASPEEVAAAGGGAGFFGRASERRRLIPGLWGMHFFDRQPLQPFWTRGGGMQHDGWFGGVFVNSYDRLSVIAGVEREWLSLRSPRLGVGVGYRAGLLTGYDRQLFELAEKTPVLPFVGLDVWLQTGPIAVDVFYVFRALSVEASIAY